VGRAADGRHGMTRFDELMEASKHSMDLFEEIGRAAEEAADQSLTPQWFNAFVKEHYGGIVYLDRETVGFTTVEGDGYWLGDEIAGYIHYIPIKNPHAAVLCAVAFLQGVGSAYSGMLGQQWDERSQRYNTAGQSARLVLNKPEGTA